MSQLARESNRELARVPWLALRERVAAVRASDGVTTPVGAKPKARRASTTRETS